MRKIKIIVVVMAAGLLVAVTAAAYRVKNPELRGIPVNVTTVTQSAITSTPAIIPGSALHRVACEITNADTDYDIRVTWAATTYTAKDQIDGLVLTVIIPPGSTKRISGPNYSPGPWTLQTDRYGKNMYWQVSPTPKNSTGTFTAERRYNTPPD